MTTEVSKQRMCFKIQGGSSKVMETCACTCYLLKVLQHFDQSFWRCWEGDDITNSENQVNPRTWGTTNDIRLSLKGKTVVFLFTVASANLSELRMLGGLLQSSTEIWWKHRVDNDEVCRRKLAVDSRSVSPSVTPTRTAHAFPWSFRNYWTGVEKATQRWNYDLVWKCGGYLGEWQVQVLSEVNCPIEAGWCQDQSPGPIPAQS